MLANCRLCPRKCGVNRLKGETGYCGIGAKAVVAGSHAHFGEEPELVGPGGSGAIFFSGCNLRCVFCQNFEISRADDGIEVDNGELADMMTALQREGCGNINLVSPSHVAPQILAALAEAAENGLAVPVIYNTGGYDSVETLKLFDGVVDIYMPDFKFWRGAVSKAACGAADYSDAAKKAIAEMHRQRGDLVIDSESGMAVSGLLARHLVMPDGLPCAEEIMRFLHDEISPRICVNIMSQYRPCGEALLHPVFSRRTTKREWQDVIDAAVMAGITRFIRV
jgi:putative pyruvate formate lyase activating enzyme